MSRYWNSTTITAWASFSSRTLLNVTITFLTLIYLSVNEIALWYLFATVLAVSALLDMGFSPTFIRFCAYVKGGAQELWESEIHKTAVVSWTLLGKLYTVMSFIYMLISLSILVFMIFFGPLLISKQVLEAGNSADLWWAWWVLSFGAAINFYAKKYDSLLRGFDFVPLVNRLDALWFLLAALACAVLLFFHRGILELTLAVQFGQFLNMLTKRVAVKRLFPKEHVRFGIKNLDLMLLRTVWKPSWRTGLLSLAGQSVSQFSGLIFAQFLAALPLAQYLLALRLMTLICEFSATPFYSKIQIYARLRLEENTDKLQKSVLPTMRNALLIFTALSVATGVFAPFIFRLLGKNLIFVPFSLWSLMALVWFLERQASMHAQLYMTTNHVPFHLAYSLTAGLNIILLFVLVRPMGIWAAPISQLLSQSIINNWWNVKISLASLGASANKYFRNVFMVPLICITFMLLISVIL